MQLTTSRFVLRDFQDADLAAFAAYHADPRSSELYGPQQADSRDAAQLVALFKAWACEQPRLNFQLAVVRHDGVLVGCCGLRRKDAEPGSAELGVELAPQYWGRFGYAMEVLKRLARFGFADLGLTRLYGSTVSANTRISRLAAALGAVAVARPTPAWMQAKGWRQLEWQIALEQWLARSSSRLARGA